MSTHFHTLKVKAIDKTTPDCSIVTLAVDERLEKDFAFKQGQYLTLKALIDGEEVQRSYSLCSTPHGGLWQVGIKEVPGGKFSTFANQRLKVGDSLDVMAPNGRFFVDVDTQADRHMIAFAAGSGITPIYSIIRTHLESEPNTSFKLFYINKTVGSIILKEEIEALKNRFMDRFEVFHFLTRETRGLPLLDGRLTKEKLEVIFSEVLTTDQVDHCFSCGPEEMIFMVRDFLLSKNVDEKKIHLKNLTGLTSSITIKEGGKTFNFDISDGSDNILDAALKAGADLPFACKGGVCCTCRAKVVEGQVDMLVNYALEQEEVDEGFVLTCQAIPKTETVVVDFDE